MIHRGQDTTKNAAELMLNGTFGRVAVFHREQLRPSFLPVIILAPFKKLHWEEVQPLCFFLHA